MKKILFVLLLFIPFIVLAEDLEYHICKNGCAYTELETIMAELNALRGTSYDVSIYIDDDSTYELTDNNYLYNKRGWVNGHYMSRINTLYIEGTNGKPTITTNSLHQDFNYVDRSIFIELWSDITIKNIKFDLPDSMLIGTNGALTFEDVDMKCTQYYTYSTATNNTINNLNVVGDFYINKGTITNATINGVLEVDRSFVGENINIDGALISDGNFNINNVNINAEGYDYGFKVTYEDCFGDCPAGHYAQDSYINNTTIKNAEKEAILYQRGPANYDYPLHIDNADLSDNPTSIVMHNIFDGWFYNTYYDGYSVLITNSKVSGAETAVEYDDWYYRDDINIEFDEFPEDFNALNMYFDLTNTWVKPIKRVSDASQKDNSKSNVLETRNGKIVIDRKNSGVLVLNVDKEVSLSKFFDDVGLVLGEIEIVDKTIVKYENDKLVPLKIGETDVHFETDSGTYVLHVSVTELPEKENPVTADRIVLLAIIFITSISIAILLIRRKKMLE